MQRRQADQIGLSAGFFRPQLRKKYSVWAYDGGEVIQVYPEPRPCTHEIWFQFDDFSKFYWTLMESKCIDEVRGVAFYNPSKTHRFMLEYMLTATNLPEIDLADRERDGRLSERQRRKIYRVHPRIYRMLFEQIQIIPDALSKEEHKVLEKQCSNLFGNGNAVNDAHPWLSNYLNLISFWEKFGLNYFDLLRLPQETFNQLRTVMQMEITYKNKSTGAPPPSHAKPPMMPRRR